MKIKCDKAEKVFQPFKIELTIENQDELLSLLARLNFSESKIIEELKEFYMFKTNVGYNWKQSSASMQNLYELFEEKCHEYNLIEDKE
jgi:hypothetical protein